MELGERIAVLREEQALTQAELAEAARISPSTLSQIESGKVPRPHVGTVRKIARALGVEPAELRRAKEPAVPLAEAPREAGQAAIRDQAKREAFIESLGQAEVGTPPETINNVLHELALQQAPRDVQAINRAHESDQVQMVDTRPEYKAQDYLRSLRPGEGDIAHIELMQEKVRMEQEINRLREELSAVREQEQTHP